MIGKKSKNKETKGLLSLLALIGACGTTMIHSGIVKQVAINAFKESIF